jgi:hypothetical protein
VNSDGIKAVFAPESISLLYLATVFELLILHLCLNTFAVLSITGLKTRRHVIFLLVRLGTSTLFSVSTIFLRRSLAT